jgi:capsular polysaccharide biosynthesis protein
MSQQALDLRRSIQIVWRHKILMAAAVLLGILAGGAYSYLNPPMQTSTALVVLPQNAQSAQATANGGPDPYTATQEVVASSSQVLEDALPDTRPRMSLAELRREIQVGSLTSYVISISAKSKNAANSNATANAVANSYIRYIGSASSPVGHVSAHLLQPATGASGLAPLEVLIVDALIGAIAGALIGAVIALAITRADRRLRERDEIANSIGVPVIASFTVTHPSDAAGWARLLEDYKPEVLHALQLRKALHHLGMASVNTSDGGESGRSSVTILSLASDSRGLAIGPQLATFAASQGIPTVLVFGPQQDPDATATLRTACAAPPASSNRPNHLRVIVSDDHIAVPLDAALIVVVAVVNGASPRMPETMYTTTTLLGVSSGAATAEQMARVAVRADADSRELTGIIVADPDPTDHTTGRIPQLSRPQQRRLPTRLKGITTGITTEMRR